MYGVLKMRRILILGCCYLLAACTQLFSADDCSNEILSQAKSPDGKLVASLVQKNCGATTGYANIVYLSDVDMVDDKQKKWGDQVYVLQGAPNISLAWKNTDLKIKAPVNGPDVFLKKDEWKSVKILYE
jgi:hypothetical protein